MYRYGYLLLALALGAVCLFVFWRLWSRSAEEGSTTLMDYLLVWPLVFRAERRSKTPTRLGFIVVGILVAVALFVVDGFVNVRRHG
ncbi:MAG: hypothetical protein M3N82_03465 [Pseudomonadota bacterium]|nr:hypothetical protein [Pseudomonadota bacterium]